MLIIKAVLQEIKDLNNKFDLLIDVVRSLSVGGVPFQPVPQCKYTLYAWLDEWCEVYKKPTVKPRTLSSIDVAIRVHIKRGLSDVILSDIKSIDIQKFLMTKSSRTRKIVFDVLNASLREAVAAKIIDSNPMQNIKIPAHKRKQGSAMTNKEVDEFKKAIKGHVTENYFLFLLYTGCRRNEGLSLNIADIDRKKKQLHIRGTKTDNADRIIPLFKNVAALTATILPKKDGFFFDFRPDYVTHVFKKFCPKHKLHDLRHTFATTCLAAKIPLKVVQTWLGHADFETTANIYSHVTKEINTAQADILDKFIIKKDT